MGSSDILSPSQREKLIKFMDLIHRGHPIYDLKIVFGDSMRGENSEECFANLSTALRQRDVSSCTIRTQRSYFDSSDAQILHRLPL